MTPRYRWYTGDLVTGGPLTEVDLVDATWTCPLTGAGNIGGKFPLTSGEWPNAFEDAMPGKRLLLATYDDGDGGETAIEGGPIWRLSWALATGDLQIKAFGLWTYFDHRKLLDAVLARLVEETPALAFSGSLAQIAHDIVAETVESFPETVPVVLPDRAALGTGPHVRNYPAHELGDAGERLKQLVEVVDGPEVQFAPRLVFADGAKYVEWDMRIGTEKTASMLVQDGPHHVLDARPIGSGVKDIKIDIDGTILASRGFAAGQGAGEGRPVELVSSDFLTSNGWPVLDAEAGSTDSISERSTLAAHAGGRQQLGNRPLRTVTVDWERDTAPGLASMRPGDWCDLTIGGVHRGVDGATEQRIVQMAGGNSADAAFISLAMQEGAL